MGLQSLSYFLWLPVCAAVYLKLPQKCQSPWLAVCSLWFYALNSSFDFSTPAGVLQTVLPWLVLAFVFGLLWVLGQKIYEAPAGVKQKYVRTGVIALIALLAVFKYYNLSPLPTLLDGTALARLPFPLGISFFTFGAIGYLVDIGRGTVTPAKRPVDLFVFLFFFATVTSGPILRAGQILPQLEQEHRFDTDRTTQALRLFALGLWKKVALGDVLVLVLNQVFRDIPGHGGPMLLLAALLYPMQLYFDFCGYSEMSRASGLAMGIVLPENFDAPFYSTSFSEFWGRWHMSLSGWLRDYVYFPLGGSRKGRKRKYLNIFILFCVSGLWHGNTFCYAIWGLFQAVYRLGEEALHQLFGMPAKAQPLWKRWSKRMGLYLLWCTSMVFFRIGSGPDTGAAVQGVQVLAGIFRDWSLTRFVTELLADISAGFYANTLMIYAYLAFVVFGMGLFLWLDWLRYKEGHPSEVILGTRPTLLRWALYYILVVSILAGLIIQNGGFGGGASFAYANF